MKNYRRLLMSVVVATLSLGINMAKAQTENAPDEFSSKIASGENVVLFKIHDIKPLKNSEDVVTECEFALTIYNRSPKSIDAATINLGWNDKGVSSVIDGEEKEEKKVNKIKQVKNAKTEDFVSRDLSTSVILPQIKPFRQVSLKSKIQSDRCFLMFEDAEYNFADCRVSEPTTNNSKRVSVSRAPAGGNTCKSLFRYVSPRDPEYYREFQKVSFNEEAKVRQETRKKDVDEAEANHKKMLETINAITDTLENIK